MQISAYAPCALTRSPRRSAREYADESGQCTSRSAFVAPATTTGGIAWALCTYRQLTPQSQRQRQATASATKHLRQGNVPNGTTVGGTQRWTAHTSFSRPFKARYQKYMKQTCASRCDGGISGLLNDTYTMRPVKGYIRMDNTTTSLDPA